jgi:uncharacterized protein (DUF488 family)
MEHPKAFSFGFSNRSWDATVEILQAHKIERLVDIRTLPGSRHTPQFNQENLVRELPNSGIEYVHLKSLGGLRKRKGDSQINAGWRNDSFRAYADYMQTAEFDKAINDLIRRIHEKRTAFACTEAVFWKCHRQLVSDALLIRGIHVSHIFDATKSEPHKVTTFASSNGLSLSYPSID